MAHKLKSSYLKHSTSCDPDCWLTSKDEQLMTQTRWHDNGLVETIYWRQPNQTNYDQFIVTIFHHSNPQAIVAETDAFLTNAQTSAMAQAQALIPLTA